MINKHIRKSLALKENVFAIKKIGYLTRDYLDKPTLSIARFSMLITKENILE
jgi:hypothetical protein